MKPLDWMLVVALLLYFVGLTACCLPRGKLIRWIAGTKTPRKGE